MYENGHQIPCCDRYRRSRIPVTCGHRHSNPAQCLLRGCPEVTLPHGLVIPLPLPCLPLPSYPGQAVTSLPPASPLPPLLYSASASSNVKFSKSTPFSKPLVTPKPNETKTIPLSASENSSGSPSLQTEALQTPTCSWGEELRGTFVSIVFYSPYLTNRLVTVTDELLVTSPSPSYTFIYIYISRSIVNGMSDSSDFHFLILSPPSPSLGWIRPSRAICLVAYCRCQTSYR